MRSVFLGSGFAGTTYSCEPAVSRLNGKLSFFVHKANDAFEHVSSSGSLSALPGMWRVMKRPSVMPPCSQPTGSLLNRPNLVGIEEALRIAEVDEAGDG